MSDTSSIETHIDMKDFGVVPTTILDFICIIKNGSQAIPHLTLEQLRQIEHFAILIGAGGLDCPFRQANDEYKAQCQIIQHCNHGKPAQKYREFFQRSHYLVSLNMSDLPKFQAKSGPRQGVPAFEEAGLFPRCIARANPNCKTKFHAA